MPKKDKDLKNQDRLAPKQLEEHEPGATKEEVLATLVRVARTPKPKEADPKKPEK
jgi:hypothetical protein